MSMFLYLLWQNCEDWNLSPWGLTLLIVKIEMGSQLCPAGPSRIRWRRIPLSAHCLLSVSLKTCLHFQLSFVEQCFVIVVLVLPNRPQNFRPLNFISHQMIWKWKRYQEAPVFPPPALRLVSGPHPWSYVPNSSSCCFYWAAYFIIF